MIRRPSGSPSLITPAFPTVFQTFVADSSIKQIELLVPYFHLALF